MWVEEGSASVLEAFRGAFLDIKVPKLQENLKAALVDAIYVQETKRHQMYN